MTSPPSKLEARPGRGPQQRETDLWIGFSLFGTGIAGLLLYDLNLPPVLSVWAKIDNILANSIWNSLDSWALSTLPLFVLMGEIL